MGFWDSLKTGLGGVLGQVGGQLIGAGANYLAGELFNTGKNNYGGGAYYQPVPPGWNPLAAPAQPQFSTTIMPGGAFTLPQPAPTNYPLAPYGVGGAGMALPTSPLQLTAGGLTGMFDLPFVDIAPQGTVAAMGGGSLVGAPLRQTMGGIRAARFGIMANGKLYNFRPEGRCLLSTGDLAAAKRVDRVARRARRRRPR